MLDLFRAVFLGVGRRRHPSLPKYDVKCVTNLTWQQLYQLKLELSASWSVVTSWTRLLFPGLPMSSYELYEKCAAEYFLYTFVQPLVHAEVAVFSVSAMLTRMMYYATWRWSMTQIFLILISTVWDFYKDILKSYWILAIYNVMVGRSLIYLLML